MSQYLLEYRITKIMLVEITYSEVNSINHNVKLTIVLNKKHTINSEDVIRRLPFSEVGVLS